jgi:Holliday junction resolvase RusA-like endonuclease
MNEHQVDPAPLLRIVLPGVVSWSRPRKVRGGVRYPPAYARAGAAWALLVVQAVREARWAPPPGARYHVAVGVAGGGRRDLDRVCTAALDALQAGGAVRDDCLVDALVGIRWAAVPGTRSSTRIAVVAVPPSSATAGTRPRSKRTSARPSPRGGTEEPHGR